VKRRRNGRIVVLHLAVAYPFAGVVWQLLHHLIGFRDLGLDVYYIEDHGAWVYDAVLQTLVSDPTQNLKLLADVFRRFGFENRWAFYDAEHNGYFGMTRERCHQLLADADAVINLCGATRPRDDRHVRCLAYLETDPGALGVEIQNKSPRGIETASAHNLFFTYAANIGSADCRLVTGGLEWHRTRPPVLMDQWRGEPGLREPEKFTTVGTWHNKGYDVQIAGETYFWSKHINFRNVLDVARRAGQPIELATNLNSGPDYDRALDGGFTFRPVVPMSLDLDAYRQYLSNSRGEFTVAKDLYARTRSGWFSDRSVCYLAAGRPVVTQRTGFEKYVPEGRGLMGFDNADEAVAAIHAINADYRGHCRAAQEIAFEYFDASKVLDEIAEILGL
jgi:hypothetical protein